MVKFLLLAVAFGLAHAQLEGKWKTVAILADNEDKIAKGGPLEIFIREITCEEGCKIMKVKFYVNQNGQCSLTTVNGYLQEDGETFRNQYEGENYYELVKATSENILFYSENVDRASRKTKLLFVVGKGQPLTEEQKEKLAEYAEEKDIPPASMREVLDTDKNGMRILHHNPLTMESVSSIIHLCYQNKIFPTLCSEDTAY
ncbi:odorant-binding protein 1b-like [Apodemus sylvaticus]|uniref:odorant-binding protein 1b-like n=1 Tax=Apodemus sylvaticus TaxID=10129 RepID=UPI002243AF9E|nr:odorant-binding protein 1b-like [Apodemus sylvaticus]